MVREDRIGNRGMQARRARRLREPRRGELLAAAIALTGVVLPATGFPAAGHREVHQRAVRAGAPLVVETADADIAPAIDDDEGFDEVHVLGRRVVHVLRRWVSWVR